MKFNAKDILAINEAEVPYWDTLEKVTTIDEVEAARDVNGTATFGALSNGGHDQLPEKLLGSCGPTPLLHSPVQLRGGRPVFQSGGKPRLPYRGDVHVDDPTGYRGCR